MGATYSPTQDELRAAVDRRLEQSLLEAAIRLPEADSLLGELRRVVVAGGKRVRPAFCYWGFRAAGGEDNESIIRASASLELLHTFAIVHDDIMDGSDLRRAISTINATRGTDVALLAGDLALILADEELMSSGFDDAVAARAFGVYSRMRQEVVAGQYLELELSASDLISEDDARRVAVLKSGRYSVREPLVIGATLGGASSELIVELAAAGELLGEAFQLADDLLGTFGDGRRTGKPVDSDVRSGKRNMLFAATAAALEGRELAVFLAKWGGGDSLDEGDVRELRELIESSGAKTATEALLAKLTAEAVDQLNGAAIEEPPRRALLDLAARVTSRTE
jgi:geranylgeranyl diphosphate synthase type I